MKPAPQVSWFGSSLHFHRESAKRTSEPRPHQIHRFLVSFRIRSSQRHPLQKGANFGFGTPAVCKQGVFSGSSRPSTESIRLLEPIIPGKCVYYPRRNSTIAAVLAALDAVEGRCAGQKRKRRPWDRGGVC